MTTDNPNDFTLDIDGLPERATINIGAAIHERLTYGREPTSCENDFDTALARSFEQLRNQTALLMDRAIREWSAQLGWTPERWLQVYDIVPELVRNEYGDAVKVTVTAKPRDDFAFSVKL